MATQNPSFANDLATDAATTTTAAHKSITRFAVPAARVVLGLGFLVFGLAYFIHFMPEPKGPFPEGAMKFGGALAQTGYMMELVKGTEVLCGALILFNLFTPLALVVLAPVLVNIVAFHIFLEPSGLPVPLVLVALTLFLAWSYRDSYRPLFVRRARLAGR